MRQLNKCSYQETEGLELAFHFIATITLLFMSNRDTIDSIIWLKNIQHWA